MVQPLEVNVGNTYAAIAIGVRTGNGHPSAKLGRTPYVATTKLLTYQWEDLGVQAKVLVSTDKTTTSIRTGGGFFDGKYKKINQQYFAIMAQGSNPSEIKQEIEEIAKRLGADDEFSASNRKDYSQEFIRFLGGGAEVEEAVQRVSGQLKNR